MSGLAISGMQQNNFSKDADSGGLTTASAAVSAAADVANAAVDTCRSRAKCYRMALVPYFGFFTVLINGLFAVPSIAPIQHGGHSVAAAVH